MQFEAFWTSSFKKLLSANEDQNKMELIRNILRKSMNGMCIFDENRKENYYGLSDKEKLVEINNNNNKQGNTLKCHVYETIKPKRIHLDTIKNNVKNISDRVKEKVAKFEDLQKQSSSESVNTPSITDRLFIDSDGKPLSPILKPRDAETRFIVNAYESRPSGCWKARPKRPDNIDNTQIIRIIDSAPTTNNIVSAIDAAHSSPDKILAANLRKKQNRIQSSISIMMEIEDLDEESIVEELNKRASHIELNESVPSYAEPIYATPMKTPKKKNKTQIVSAPILPKDNNTGDNNATTFQQLRQQADIQCKIMRQAAKALDHYRSTYRHDVAGQVEAERILLTASHQHERLLQEIRQIEYEEPVCVKNIGRAELDNVQLGLKEDQNERWFVLVVSDAKRVFSSEAVNVKAGQRNVEFPNKFVFDNLKSDFEINLNVYAMAAIDTKPKSKRKKSSKKLYYIDLHTRNAVADTIPSSSFKLCGAFKMTVGNMRGNCNWRIITGCDSPLDGSLSLRARLAEVRIEEARSGFLDVGIAHAHGIAWNRRWSVLDGTRLNFWNYPNEADAVKPMDSVDLEQCRREIVPAPRSQCARARTLLLETDQRRFLHADSVDEVHDWRQRLNGVFDALRNWRLLRH